MPVVNRRFSISVERRVSRSVDGSIVARNTRRQSASLEKKARSRLKTTVASSRARLPVSTIACRVAPNSRVQLSTISLQIVSHKAAIDPGRCPCPALAQALVSSNANFAPSRSAAIWLHGRGLFLPLNVERCEAKTLFPGAQIELLRALHEFFDAEVVQHKVASGIRHLPGLKRISKHSANCRGERVRIAGWQQ